MKPLWTDARVLTRVGIVEMLAVQLYNQREHLLQWQQADASVRSEWRKEARKVYDEALMNFGE